MRKSSLIEYEGKKYWLDISSGFPNLETMNPDGSFHDTLLKEVDVMSVIQWGHVIGDKKPE